MSGATTKAVLAWLEKVGTKSARDGMARYGIHAKHAYGVPMSLLMKKAKEIGRDQTLSLELWDTGCYEARLLATMVGDPKKVTRAQMNAWAKGFENWADGDTACFKLFDRSPLAWDMVRPWAKAEREYTRRGAFALTASLALHDKTASDARFLDLLPVIEEGAADGRNFVKKGVNWALRGVGRRNAALFAAATVVARRLSLSKEAAPRWVGKDALREFAKVKERVVKPKLAKKAPRSAKSV